MKRIRILSYHHIQNNGAYLFTHALTQLLKKQFPNDDIRVADYRTVRLSTYEFLKQFKFYKELPLFNLRRTALWKKQINLLELDGNTPKFNSRQLLRYLSENCEAVIVGMDVWCLARSTERPQFPNPYWLPGPIRSSKIAYAVSAYSSNTVEIEHHSQQIKKYLNEFNIIGVRDRFTLELVAQHRSRRDGIIDITPDPTLVFDFSPPDTEVLKKKLILYGLDFNRPRMGLMLHGRSALASDICQHYKSLGYQTIALSMFTPHADINLGHLLTPLEWAHTFQYLNICFGDRFHGTIFSIKNGIPFITFEGDINLPKNQSKNFDLLRSFEMTDCYRNQTADNFSIQNLLGHAMDLEKAWHNSFQNKIKTTLSRMKLENERFMKLIHQSKQNWQ